MRKPEIGKFVGPTKHEAEPQGTDEGSQEEKVDMDVDQQSYKETQDHAGLT